LKTVVLHGNLDGEVHMTQSVGFIAAKSVSVGWARWSSFGWTTCGFIP